MEIMVLEKEDVTRWLLCKKITWEGNNLTNYDTAYVPLYDLIGASRPGILILNGRFLLDERVEKVMLMARSGELFIESISRSEYDLLMGTLIWLHYTTTDEALRQMREYGYEG